MLLQLNLEKKWQMNISCVVECPVNCQLSDWSVWSECSQTCGLEGKIPNIRYEHDLSDRKTCNTVFHINCIICTQFISETSVCMPSFDFRPQKLTVVEERIFYSGQSDCVIVLPNDQ